MGLRASMRLSDSLQRALEARKAMLAAAGRCRERAGVLESFDVALEDYFQDAPGA